MSDQDLFNDDKKDEDQKKETPPNDLKQDQSTNYDQMLGMVVNAEGKQKYDSVESLIKGAVHGQAHIANLEQELSALKASEGDNKKVEDIIKALQSQKDDQSSDDKEKPPGMSQTDIQDLVKNTLTDINSQTVQQTNIKTVTDKFKELYGDKASETLYSKADDLSMSKEDINSLIAKNPTAAFKLLGVEHKDKPVIPPMNSSVNTEEFQKKGSPPVESSMGYISSKQLTSNWEVSKAKTLKRLGET